MKNLFAFFALGALLLLFPLKGEATIFLVNSQQSFNEAQNDAATNDSIVWESGKHSNIYMNITKANLYVGAQVLGEAIFNGASRIRISSDYVTIEGLQFVGGDIGDEDVIYTTGSYNHFNEINIRAYTSYKYLIMREECQYNRVTYCNFENRRNLDDQNILSILVSANQPGYNKVQYCSFKNFEGTGNDLGIEPIRIGVSTQADRNSRSLVEYCYFTECDGDGELISSKASQNVYRYNTFERNTKAELVLRHGSEAIVYGNFFLTNRGGVRVREGQDHYIYNNYFQGQFVRTIYLQNEDSDPLDNINIAFNTIIDCSEVILGGDGNDKPTNVTFANNIFTLPDDDLFEEQTGTETWIGNIYSGDLGIPVPANGLTENDPQLEQNSAGFYGLSTTSPAINAAQPGYLPLPQFAGMEDIDMDVLFDLMGQDRPQDISEKDLGCNEFPHNIMIQPIATEENTGPSYNTSMISNTDEVNIFVKDLISIAPNPVSNQTFITLDIDSAAKIQLELFDINGKKIDTIFNDKLTPGNHSFTKNFELLPTGIYTIKATSQSIKEGQNKIQTLKFIKQ